jgi:hypothetical protein
MIWSEEEEEEEEDRNLFSYQELSQMVSEFSAYSFKDNSESFIRNRSTYSQEYGPPFLSPRVSL